MNLRSTTKEYHGPWTVWTTARAVGQPCYVISAEDGEAVGIGEVVEKGKGGTGGLAASTGWRHYCRYEEAALGGAGQAITGVVGID